MEEAKGVLKLSIEKPNIFILQNGYHIYKLRDTCLANTPITNRAIKCEIDREMMVD